MSLAYQKKLLPGVSRTFALTIPLLPEPLCAIVTNAYLLCRIVATIEDDDSLTLTESQYFPEKFRHVLEQQASPQSFANALLAKISAQTPRKELELIQEIPYIIACLRTFTVDQQAQLIQCVNIMSRGMSEFQRNASLAGLKTMAQLDNYCYHVAGVVGEMLTELFCDYAPAMMKHKTQAVQLAVTFGQALQMTNILADIWEDQQRGICWLPQELFLKHNIDLAQGLPVQNQLGYQAAIQELCLNAFQHLNTAMEYFSLIPATEIGIKQFTLLPINLAALTLNHIYDAPGFTDRNHIKINRHFIKPLVFSTKLAAYHSLLAKHLFARLGKKLHLAHNLNAKEISL